MIYRLFWAALFYFGYITTLILQRWVRCCCTVRTGGGCSFRYYSGCSHRCFAAGGGKQCWSRWEAFPKKYDCVNAIFISYAAGLIVPGSEVSRCGVLAKYDNVSFAKSLGTVVTERLVDTLTILLITGVTVLLQLPIFVTFLQQTGTKIPSLLHLLTSVWFYIVLFCFINYVE